MNFGLLLPTSFMIRERHRKAKSSHLFMVFSIVLLLPVSITNFFYLWSIISNFQHLVCYYPILSRKIIETVSEKSHMWGTFCDMTCKILWNFGPDYATNFYTYSKSTPHGGKVRANESCVGCLGWIHNTSRRPGGANRRR